MHPNIDVRLVSASDSVYFSRDKVHLGVRYSHGSWPGLASDRLFDNKFFFLFAALPCCSKPKFVRRPTCASARCCI